MKLATSSVVFVDEQKHNSPKIIADIFDDEATFNLIAAFDFDKILEQRYERLFVDVEDRVLKDRENSLQRLDNIGGTDHKHIGDQHHSTLSTSFFPPPFLIPSPPPFKDKDDLSSDEGEQEQAANNNEDKLHLDAASQQTVAMSAAHLQQANLA